MALNGDFLTVRSFDGTRIVWAAFGDPKAEECVVLANGIACSDTYWPDLVSALVASGRRVLFFDYRGHGRSARPANPNEIHVGSHARDLWAVADAARADQVTLLGYSMGVQTSLEAYRLQPERVRSIVAVAGTFEHPLKGLYRTGIGRWALAGIELAVEPAPWLARRLWPLGGRTPQVSTSVAKATSLIGRDVPDRLMADYFRHAASMDPVVLVRMARALHLHTARDLLPDVNVPVAIFAGARDVLTPPQAAREMASLLPDASLEVFELSTHTLPVDEPNRLATGVVAHLDGLAVRDAEPNALFA